MLKDLVGGVAKYSDHGLIENDHAISILRSSSNFTRTIFTSSIHSVSSSVGLYSVWIVCYTLFSHIGAFHISTTVWTKSITWIMINRNIGSTIMPLAITTLFPPEKKHISFINLIKYLLRRESNTL